MKNRVDSGKPSKKKEKYLIVQVSKLLTVHFTVISSIILLLIHLCFEYNYPDSSIMTLGKFFARKFDNGNEFLFVHVFASLFETYAQVRFYVSNGLKELFVYTYIFNICSSKAL